MSPIRLCFHKFTKHILRRISRATRFGYTGSHHRAVQKNMARAGTQLQNVVTLLHMIYFTVLFVLQDCWLASFRNRPHPPPAFMKPQVSLPLINVLKPIGYVMHQQFNIQQLYALPTLYLCVLCLSENKQRLVPLTA